MSFYTLSIDHLFTFLELRLLQLAFVVNPRVYKMFYK